MRFHFTLALLFLISLSFQAPASTTINIVATTPSMGFLAREVGGSHVRVTELAPPDRNYHTLQVKPSMIQAVHRADLVVAVGAELEIGWLPAVIESAANAKVAIGKAGYFDASKTVTLIDKPTGKIDRSRGDIHPDGNPHFYFDPLRMGIAAEALAVRLAKLDPTHANDYTHRAHQLAQTLKSQVDTWQIALKRNPSVLLYHADANYLFNRFDIPILGLIEPLPGFPPTASHISNLVTRYQGKTGLILCLQYQLSPAINQLGKTLGWPVKSLPGDMRANGLLADYVVFISQWMNILTVS